MKVNEGNIVWATGRLMDFSGWRRFPETPGDLQRRARAFLKLVHNRPIREILTAAALPNQPIEFKGLDPDQIDADWILDLVADTLDYFPAPVTMREMYCAKLPPATETTSEVASA